MSAQVPVAAYLILAAVLFSIGVAAFLIKRNLITIFMSIELMLNAVNLTFVAFAHMWHQVSGQIFVFFVMVVAAAEAAVGLAIIIAIFRTRETLNVDSDRPDEIVTSMPPLELHSLADSAASLRRLPHQRNDRPQAAARSGHRRRTHLHRDSCRYRRVALGRHEGRRRA